MKLPKHVEHWDDESDLDHGIIVTLRYGYSFEHHQHSGVMGFDTARDARNAIKLENLWRCNCAECVKHKGA